MKTFAMIVYFVAIVALVFEVAGRSVRSTDPFEECQADPATCVDEELLNKFGRGDLEDETPLAVHVLCMNVKKGLQRPTGEINVEGLRAYLKLGGRHPIDFVNRVMNECASKKGAMAQEAAVGLLQCIYSIMPHEIGTHGIYSYYHQPPRVARRSITQHGILSENSHSDVHLQQPMKKDLFHQFHNDCQADPASRVDEYLFLRIFQGEEIEEPTFGLHTLCINVKGGLQSQNGDINQENLLTYLTSSRTLNSTVVDEIIKECGHRNGVTASEAAVALLRCLMSQEKRLKHHEEHGTQVHKDHHNQTVEVSGRPGRTHFEECQSDPNTYVNAALIRKGLRGELADKTPLGPHALCVNIKRGFQNQNGDINVDALRTYLNQADNRDSSLVDQVVKECGQRNGTTAQLAALALLDCIHHIIPHDEQHHKECPSREEIDEDQYFDALRGAHEYEASLAHYVICHNVQDGIQSRNGDVSIEGIRAYLTDGPRHNATAVDIIVKECGQRKGATVQDAAWALIRCLHHHIIAMEPKHD